MNESKGVLIIIIIAFAVLGGIIFFPFSSSTSATTEASDFLRIHIRANSNYTEDQNIKYEVKDEIVKVLAPLLSEAETKAEAMSIISNNLSLIMDTADRILSENGFDYTCEANVHSEYFPTRTYEDLTLESDIYDALILELGTGTGDNWWCVVYPPMCFINYSEDSSEDIVYKSKLVEIITNFFS